MKNQNIMMLAAILLISFHTVHAGILKSIKKGTKNKIIDPVSDGSTEKSIEDGSNTASNEVAAPIADVVGGGAAGNAMLALSDIKSGDADFNNGQYQSAMKSYIDAIAHQYATGTAPVGQPTKDDLWNRVTECLNKVDDKGTIIVDPYQVKDEIDSVVKTILASKTNNTVFKTKGQITDYMYQKAATVLYGVGVDKMNSGTPLAGYQDYFIQAHAMDSSKLIPDTITAS